jgi:hypothetical protein
MANGTTKEALEEMMKSGITADRKAPAKSNTKSDLEGRYGAVGISAVAAALPYQSDAKNSAYARIESQSDYDRFVNTSA